MTFSAYGLGMLTIWYVSKKTNLIKSSALRDNCTQTDKMTECHASHVCDDEIIPHPLCE